MKQHKIGLGIAFGVALGIAAPALAEQAVQWRVEDGGNGHWYRVVVVTPGSSWTAANAAAASQSGYLASVRSSAEAAFVNAVANATEGAFSSNPGGNQVGPWLGGTRILGTNGWRWTSDESWSFTQWCGGEPNGGSGEPYVHLMRNGSVICWNDRENNAFGTGNPSFVVEFSADCNADGIVDYGQCRDGSLPDYDGDNVLDCCEAGTPCIVGNYPVQWRVADGGNGHWYARLIYPQQPWQQCRALAQARGADLVSITGDGERLVVESVILAGGPIPVTEPRDYWLGGIAPTGGGASGWLWSDGSPWSYTYWGPGLPNNWGGPRYLIERPSPIGWDDYFDSDTPYMVGAIIEWSADCNGDQIVDYGQILDGTYDDLNSNGIPDCCDQGIECDCPADINQSGTIDAEDLAYVLFAWGMTGGKAGDADINGDATVDANDLSLVLGSWGMCP